MFRKFALLALLMLASVGAFGQVFPPPNSMNFQGRLATPNGNPVPDGQYSIRFSLWTAPAEYRSTELWNQTLPNVAVKNGVFAVTLTGIPASIFNINLYLEIKVGNDPPLSPRQQLFTVPYAFKANSVTDGSITASSLAPNSVSLGKLDPTLFPSNVWTLNGNPGTAGNFLGTTNNQPLVVKVNNQRAMQISYAANSNNQFRTTNILNGSAINDIQSGVIGATISGGGVNDTVNNLNQPQRVYADYGTIGGGAGNSAWNYSTVAGGFGNRAFGSYAAIPGGGGNTADGFAAFAAGYNNQARGDYATIIGGSDNYAPGTYPIIVGGLSNRADGFVSVTLGGSDNYAQADFSLAAGNHAKAAHIGAFVWADYNTGTFASTAQNQFLVRASGGVGINTNDPAGFALNVNGTAKFAGNIVVNGVTYTSDARYKTQIAPIANALDSLLKLRGVTYEWNRAAFPGNGFAAGRQIGFLAQEIEPIFPELVFTDRTGYKSVNYIGILPVMVEALKTQQQQHLQDAAAIKALQSENADMKARLDRIEALLKQSGQK